MTVSTVGELQLGLTALSDAIAAAKARFADLPADEQLVVDGLEIASIAFPELAPFMVAVPVAELLVNWIVANNTQGQPGSETPIHDVSRGSALQSMQHSTEQFPPFDE